MTTIQATQTAPITARQIVATVAITILAIAGIAVMPTLDAQTGIIVFGTSVTTLLILVTGIGLHTYTTRQALAKALTQLHKQRTLVLLMSFGLGATLAAGFASIPLALTLGAILLVTAISLFLPFKREFHTHDGA